MSTDPRPVLATLRLRHGQADLQSRDVRVDEREERLTPTEAGLLAYLAANAERPVPREELLEQVWGYRPGVRSRTLDTTIRRLRAKVEVNPSDPDHIITEPGIGYRFVPLTPSAGPEVPGDELDAFVGRHAELQRLSEVAEGGARLVTLLGPGGVGKTRLAARWVRRHPGLVVELAALTRATGLLPAVAAAAGIKEALDPATLARGLATKGFEWVLLDNVEQLLPDAVETIHGLATASGLGVLLTSRERLRVAGETVVEVPPLPKADAIALLRARAPSALAEAEDENLARIVERLDGLPLALELAAGRAWLLGPEDLDDLLAQPLDGLDRRRTGGRQASMRSSILWSWRLLDARHRAALAALAVFRGGFGVDAASEVLAHLAPDGPDPEDAAEAADGDHDPLAVLQALRDRSWLARRRAPDGRTRLDMLVPIRELVVEELGHDALAADAHARHYAALGTDDARDACEQGDGTARRALVAEWDNLLAAADHALDRAATDHVFADVAAGAALAIFEAARLDRPPDEVRPRLTAAARLDGLSPAVRARLLVDSANLDRSAGSTPRSFARVEEAAAIAEEVGDDVALALACAVRALLHQEKGELGTAETWHRQAIAAARRAGAARTEGIVQSNLANLYLRQGRPHDARAELEDATATLRSHDYRRLEAIALGNLALAWHEAGDLGEAEAAYLVALDRHEALGNARYAALVRGNIGSLALDRGDLRGGERFLREAVAAHDAVGDLRLEGIARQSLAECLRRLGQVEEARTQATAARRLASVTRNRLLRLVVEAIEGELMGAEGQAQAGVRRCLEAAERLDELGAPVEAAIARCRAVRVGGDGDALLDRAEAVRQSQGLGPDSELARHIAEARGA